MNSAKEWKSTMLLKPVSLIAITIACFLITSCNNSEQASTTQNKEENTEELKGPESLSFPSLDSIPVSAKYYHSGDDNPTIVLCHQARYNKFEYEGTAQRLNELGFNCLAIDQRSGGPLGIHINETSEAAKKAGKPTDFIDAEQDIIAAVTYAKENYGGKTILWGSSYSSTLVLYVAMENENVDAVISFSPGNYFSPEKGSLIEKFKEFDKPMFVTSSLEEAPYVSELFAEMEMNNNQTQFIPQEEGYHGSRSLWPTQPGGEEYWEAITDFLNKIN